MARYVLVRERDGCDGCTGCMILGVIAVAVIGTILYLLFQFAMFALKIALIILMAVLGIFYLVTLIWAAVFWIKNIVRAIVASVKHNHTYLSPTASGFVNVLRRIGGFLKDFVVAYCKLNARSIKEKFNELRTPRMFMLKRVALFFVMCNIALLAYVSPFTGFSLPLL